MSRYIDADALKRTMLNTPVKAVEGVDFDAEWFTRIANTAVQFADMVENAPTVDAVSVTRCGECKYSKSASDDEDGYVCLFHQRYYGKHSGMLWMSGDYCSYGERKDGEHD